MRHETGVHENETRRDFYTLFFKSSMMKYIGKNGLLFYLKTQNAKQCRCIFKSTYTL